MNNKKLFKTIAISALTVALGVGIFVNKTYIRRDIDTVAVAYTNGDGDTYYNDISETATGTELLTALQSLNSKKRKTTVGYSSMWSYYDQTDYDPNNTNKYLAFYRGTSANKNEMNKEHVWPKSRGGDLVEGDIHMPRPTLTSDNSDRGNSFYVEGKVSTTSGWDPKAAGMTESYRGDSARIIFYCVVANSSLSLVDKENDSTSNKTMGKLSDLLKWNLEYPVQQREMNRNEGCESIQGNRNPFIDHPEYACKIWGDTNDATREICGMGYQPTKELKITGTLANLEYHVDDWFDPTGLTVTYYEDDVPTNVTSKCMWNLGKFETAGEYDAIATYHEVSDTYSQKIIVLEKEDEQPPTEPDDSGSSDVEPPVNPPTPENKGGGGCSASISGGSNSILFIVSATLLFFAIRQAIRIRKKEDK